MIRIYYEATEQFDLAKEMKEINKTYFNDEIKLNFPIEYGPVRKAYGKCFSRFTPGAGTTTINRRVSKFYTVPMTGSVVVTKIQISSFYKMSLEQTREIISHELIHAKLAQSGMWKENHGANFMTEVHRVRKLGMHVPTSEDVGAFEVDDSEKLKRPIYAYLINKKWIKAFKQPPTPEENSKLSKAFRNLWGGRDVEFELVKTMSPVVMRYTVSNLCWDPTRRTHTVGNLQLDDYEKLIGDKVPGGFKVDKQGNIL